MDKKKKRFIFEEMFLLQLFVLRQKISLQKETALKITFNKELIQKFVDKLPFKLTEAQRKSAWEIIHYDFIQPSPTVLTAGGYIISVMHVKQILSLTFLFYF